MKLTKIQIANFRSIKSETIILDHNCLILLGKNEAGKSNILKAIASVFGAYRISSKDIRKRIDDETILDCYVRVIIKLDENDFSSIHTKFETEYKGTEKILFKNNKTLLEYIKAHFHEIIISTKIENNSVPIYSFWKYEENDFILEKTFYKSWNEIYTQAIGTKFDLKSELLNTIKTIYMENPYRCLYWNYDNNYLLPSSINIEEFIRTPSNQKSLENLFILCNREDIKSEFEAAIKQDGDYGNLLDQVSKKATSTFRKIWTDFKDTSIQLYPNGSEISIKVVDKARYNFEDRSDGFKKFISILLMISTRSRSNKIGERDIILIDEPDQSLYPTSARLLRDELLKISETSKVIYSTHSQYMIDSTCIDRHLVVEKKDDITNAKREENTASFSNDELLRNAIGSSIFECLKEKNIIFEGWLDRELFTKYCKFHSKTKDFNSIGTIYLWGISWVETLVQLLILANKKFIIVADSDEISTSRRKEFNKNYQEYSGSWLSYSDVCENISTMEDFIAPEYITNHLKTLSASFTFDNSKNAIQNIETITGRDKEKKQEIKKNLIAAIKKQNIKESYREYLNTLNERIVGL